jgi:hypothetical protein
MTIAKNRSKNEPEASTYYNEGWGDEAPEIYGNAPILPYESIDDYAMLFCQFTAETAGAENSHYERYLAKRPPMHGGKNAAVATSRKDSD